MSFATPVVRKIEKSLRLGSVSYLNARPLIYGLDASSRLELQLDVPSHLLEGLRTEQFDVALLPVIDYQRMDGLRLVPSGGIGCDGPTLTVRIFSRTPIESILTLACDTDSHTSVALARIVLAELYGIRPTFVELDRRADAQDDAMLLIGDKVVCEEPARMEHQLDLGAAWKRLTDLPFVFAAWMARGGIDLHDLPVQLEHAKREGLKHVDEIVTRHAVPRGWPAEIARQYLTGYLKYDVGPRQLEAIRLFHHLAAKYAITNATRPLDLYGDS